MRALLRAELPNLLVFAGAALLWGLLTDLWSIGWFAAFVGYTLWHIWMGSRLYHWFNNAFYETPSEEFFGLWGEFERALWRRLKRLQANLRRLRTARDHARARLEHLPMALVELDEGFRLVWRNPAAKKLLGLQRSDAGRHIRQFLRAPEFVQWLERGAFERPLKLSLPGQTLQVVQVQLIPFEGGWLMLLEDITQAYDLMQMRRDFVANASHELRTPLTVFTGYLETLLDMLPPDLESLRPALEQMEQQAVRMRRIIEDLLTLSAVERQSRLENEHWIDMCAQLDTLRDEADLLSAGRHEITFSCEEKGRLYGDPNLLRSVFTNLLSNAVRYTPEGGRIAVRWYVSEKGGFFEVEDTGIGIPREHIPRLTERFYRVDTARSRETGGTGLGLAIVKHVLELHGGHLEVESLPYVGSTFRAVFPINRVT
ncbi:two-component system, OmpR family, phosphate regulon sensor histidine kinase PhoR [Sulfurivirga caldicuralii]|uniref:Phosphate regulon sensor protein PhoR n=1 Tax=Sulfurivirga caldicuralii TaxID=364032 RepID=A0A1N6GE04_9GAMM|nr:phosphate regulon sensor histidine kinase PhoR [Sulfurivirga caldicuralii]SIO05707.1 two-component system, OmpR family, phosphate regulon sensor histidine kinase PhoR [Sulfurivirga caldicuralii]